ncbi:hypothetical protein DFH06DRAFT_1151697 [Mycena polygramma]|nr:hypothetical protein DFH06DRAFT_1151697 [Mycena polygramma]
MGCALLVLQPHVGGQNKPVSSTKHVEPFTKKVNDARRAAKLNTVLDDNEKLLDVGAAGQNVADDFVSFRHQVGVEDLVENRAALSEVLVIEALAGTFRKEVEFEITAVAVPDKKATEAGQSPLKPDTMATIGSAANAVVTRLWWAAFSCVARRNPAGTYKTSLEEHEGAILFAGKAQSFGRRHTGVYARGSKIEKKCPAGGR